MKTPASKPEQGQRRLLSYAAVAMVLLLCLVGLQRFLASGGVSVRARRAAPLCPSAAPL